MEFPTHRIYLPWDGNPYASSDPSTCIWSFTHSRIAARFGCIDSRSSSYLCQSSFVRSAGWYWALSTIAFWSDYKTVRLQRRPPRQEERLPDFLMTWGAILRENSNSCLFTLHACRARLCKSSWSNQIHAKNMQVFLLQCKEVYTFFVRWSIRIAATNWCIESGRGVACVSISWSLVPPCSVSGCCEQVLLSVKCSLLLCVGWSCVVCILFLPFQSLKLLLSSGTS